jgi:hypothetical protein
MTTLRRVTCVCLATGLGGAAAIAGCSSSNDSPPSQPGTPDASPDAPVADGGVDGSLKLQWGVNVLGGTGIYLDEAGTSDGGDAGAQDSSVDTGAPADGAVDDSGGGGSLSTLFSGDATVGAADGSSSDEGGGGVSSLPPLPGVTICIYQNSAIACATSAADGTFTLTGLPIRGDLVLELKKDGYQSILLPIETASSDMDGRGNPLYMSPNASPPQVGEAIDQTNKGTINAFAVQLDSNGVDLHSVPGTTVTLSPSSGIGPYFVNDNGSIDLTSTGYTGQTALFYNVDPGTYTLTYANPAFDCEPISFPFGQFGFPITTPAHSLKIITAAGYVTGIVGVLCTPDAKIVATDGGP